MDEIADHRGLFHAAGIGIEHIVTGARPAELGNDDTFAGMHLT